MNLIVRLLINALIVFGLAYALPGIHIESFWTAMLVAAILALLNAFVQPILIVLTIPVTIITLGLFIFVINAAIVLMAAAIIPNFVVDSFWWALLFSILMAALNSAFKNAGPKNGEHHLRGY